MADLQGSWVDDIYNVLNKEEIKGTVYEEKIRKRIEAFISDELDALVDFVQDLKENIYAGESLSSEWGETPDWWKD